jgi:hypothetical protein
MRKFKFKTVLCSLLFMGMGVTGFNSCVNKEVPDEPKPDENVLSGKWEVSDKTASYGSFEFTGDNKYIITQCLVALPESLSGVIAATTDRAQVHVLIHYGDYSALNNGENTYALELSEMGTITITVSGDEATITINGESYAVNKAKPIDDSEKTERLCHTWNYTQSGEGVDLLDSGYLTFTPNGTVLGKSNESVTVLGAVWEWTKDGKIKITHTDYVVTIFPDGHWGYDESKQEVSILYCNVLKLTESELILQEDDEDETMRFEIRTSR